LVWTLNVVSSIARAWTQDEIALIKDVAERTWAAVERARAEVALRGSEQRFREFAAASTDILWIRNARTLQLEFVSSAFGKIYGARPQDMLGRPGLKRWIRLVDRRDRSQVLDALRRVRSGQRVMQEYRIFRQSDGQMRWIRNTGFPLLGGANTVEYIGGIAEDYTEAKEISARLQVMVTELQHRTRNQIAVVRSLSDKTLDESQSLEDYRLRYGRRLGAMARAQQLLSRLSEGQRVFFDELLRAELAGHGANPATVSLEGPAGVPLRSSTVQTLALALHELATNAVKYGALSTPGGQLRVGWHVSDNDDGTHQRLHVDWRELGVSAVQGSEAGHSGYGRELIERALPYQLNARTQYEIGPDGVHCTIDVPISGVFRAEKN
jgi:PAS domain S-box-containing protein